MRAWSRTVGLVVLAFLATLIIGCGKGSMPQPGNTAVTITFVGGTPLAVATQIGSGAFTPAMPGSKVTLMVPNGTPKYAIAYVCPQIVSTVNAEFVVEATTQDSTAFTEDCGNGLAGSTGTATGSASSGIAGTANVEVFGDFGLGLGLGSASGSFNALMQVGNNDVAVVAVDTLSNVLGVKIARSQTVPGAINGGSGIILVPPGDATTTQFVTVNNVPAAGFSSIPEVSVEYHTANGTPFRLTSSVVLGKNPQPYAVVPAAAAQSGDFYRYESHTVSLTNQQSVNIIQTATTGGALTLTLPAPLTFSGPAPAKLPTFTFNYSGFSNLAAVADQATIRWATSATVSNEITITATANFQNGATTLTIPDLTALSGFFGPSASGTTVNWEAAIFGGSAQEFAFFPFPPATGSLEFVENQGQFIEP